MDLCSGSGCIAFGIKSKMNNASVLALEYSKDAISLIEENKSFTGLSIDVKEMDVLDENLYTDCALNSFDFWISNPPYIPEKDMVFMHANVLEFEPGMALFVSDSDPLLFYRKIAEQAILYLKNGGKLFFEIHEGYGEEMISMLESLDFVNIELRKDLQGKSRMLKAQKLLS